MKNRQRGLAAVEMAIVLPLLLLIVFGIINFGILLYDKAVITNAAREGARWAAIHTDSSFGSGCTSSAAPATPTNPCEIANSYAKTYLITFATGGATPSTTYVPGSNLYTTGDLQTVSSTYAFTGIGYGIQSYLGNLGLLTSVSSMYHE